VTAVVSPGFRNATIAGALGLTAVIGALRFGGAVPMPPRPPQPTASAVDSRATLAAATGSAAAWRSFLDQDARAAAVPVPTDAQMGTKLVYRSDDSPRTLTPGAPPVDVAGLRLEVKVGPDSDGPGDLMTLTITNLAEHDLAYRVVTRPRPGGGICNGRTLLGHDAIVVRRRATVERSECGFQSGMVLQVQRVETIEVDGLMSVYVSRVSPAGVGGDALHSKAHSPQLPAALAKCNLTPSQVLLKAIEDGGVTWRDLVDFYARHRCDRYRFPLDYRAFERDGERPLPASES
jgi:hypothetical protein